MSTFLCVRDGSSVEVVVCLMFWGIGRPSSPLLCILTDLCREKLLSSSLDVFRAFPLPVWDNEGAGIRIPFVSGGNTEAQKEVVPHPGCPAQENTVSAGLRSPRPPLSFSDSLEGLTELRKAAVLTVMIYYNERIQAETNKGNRCMGRVQERPGMGLLGVLS